MTGRECRVRTDRWRAVVRWAFGVVVVLTVTTASQKETLAIGDIGPITSTLYVRRESDKKILLTDLAAPVPLLRSPETQLAVIEDTADRRTIIRSHLDQVEVGLARQFQRLRGRHDAELLPVGADQAHGADADLFIDPLIAVDCQCPFK